tara:strand:- start:155 stop:394 length:240 start_codon:yes stop_codon:yes gene_type:complete
MTTKYAIMIRDGEYQAFYEISDKPVMDVVLLAPKIGATVLYNATSENPNVIDIVEGFMKECNDKQRFDRKALENLVKKL